MCWCTLWKDSYPGKEYRHRGSRKSIRKSWRKKWQLLLIVFVKAILKPLLHISNIPKIWNFKTDLITTSWDELLKNSFSNVDMNMISYLIGVFKIRLFLWSRIKQDLQLIIKESRVWEHHVRREDQRVKIKNSCRRKDRSDLDTRLEDS